MRRVVVPYFSVGRLVLSVTAPPCWKPGSIACTRQRARIRRPAATSSITDIATSPTTSHDLRRSVRRLVPVRVPWARLTARLRRPTRHAGARPNSRPVATVVAPASPSIRRSSAGVSAIGSTVGARRATSGMADKPMPSPRRPPKAASIRLSVSICRTSRSGLAPIAVRIDISPCRESARDSSRLARFVLAMSSTHNEAPARAMSNSRGCAAISSRSRTTVAPVRAFSLGYCVASCAAISCSSDRACSSVTPGVSRPTPRR